MLTQDNLPKPGLGIPIHDSESWTAVQDTLSIVRKALSLVYTSYLGFGNVIHSLVKLSIGKRHTPRLENPDYMYRSDQLSQDDPIMS